jgi:5'-methylthioadenosine phosphorylase
VWHETEDAVNVEMLLATLAANAVLAQDALKTLVPRLAEARRDCECGSALQIAMITQRDLIPEELGRKLAPIVEKYLG